MGDKDSLDSECEDKEQAGCCRWMFAATFRSCFGTCFKKLGTPVGYDSIDGSPGSRRSENSLNGLGFEPLSYSSMDKRSTTNLNQRSKSTSEIFRSDDFYLTSNRIRTSKRSFSMSVGLVPSDVSDDGMSNGRRSNVTSAADLRSDVSEAWWSCRGSISRSGSHRSVRSDPEFYSDDSEEIINNVDNDPKEGHLDIICEGCGEPGKHHHFSDHDRSNWRDSSFNGSLPKPCSQKWIQLD